MAQSGDHFGRAALEKIRRESLGCLVTGGAVGLEAALRRVIGSRRRHCGGGWLSGGDGGYFELRWRQGARSLASACATARTGHAQLAEQRREERLAREGGRCKKRRHLRPADQAVDGLLDDGEILADFDRDLAVIAAGYGDGYPRGTRSGAPVQVNGHRAPLVGRAVARSRVKLPSAPAGVR